LGVGFDTEKESEQVFIQKRQTQKKPVKTGFGRQGLPAFRP
jgi:hypothetical protein